VVRQYILIVDDDSQVDLRSELMLHGNFQVLFARNVEQALHFANTLPEIKFGVIDVRLDDYSPYTAEETGYGRRAGVRLLRSLEDRLPAAKFLLKTAGPDIDDVKKLVHQRKSLFLPFVVSGRVDTNMIESRASDAYAGGRLRPWILIVHGHDNNAVSALKGLLQSRFGLADVHILRDLAHQGQTIIDKFEHYARRADIVFALMTDDDEVSGNQVRARQNVIFEIGYFCSALQRTSGQLILLEKYGIEIPSDMRGLGTINISAGVDSPGILEAIARELEPLGITRS